MISFDQALILIQNQAKPATPVRVKIGESLGMVCSKRVVASKDLPAFDSSAMDGFAVLASQTLSATSHSPLTLAVNQRIEAGAFCIDRRFGQCVEIATGAVVPDAFDAVFAYEQVSHIEQAAGLSKSITLTSAARAHQNIRRRGEDLHVGYTIVESGTQIRAPHIAALAASGVSEINIRRAPLVDVFSTGAEVKTLETQTEPLPFGEIHDSNTPYLLTEMEAAGIRARHAGNVGDDPRAFADRINQPSDATILISTGGVSKGPRDFIAQALIKLGARVLFHGVAIKPGKPLLFAVLNDGRYFFGLPGNPIATAVGLGFFVQPLIRQIVGLPAQIPTKAQLTAPYLKKGMGFHFLKARRFIDAQGIVRITLLEDQSAFSVSSLMKMTGWVMVPDEVTAFKTDTPVPYVGLELFAQNH